MSKQVLANILALSGLCAGATSVQAAACRVTDFTNRTLSSLNEVQRLAFTTEMTRTEFDRLKAEPKGSPNYYSLLAEAPSVGDARQKALSSLASVPVRPITEVRTSWGSGLRDDRILDAMQVDGYRRIWASDFLTTEQNRQFLDCISKRQPGLTVAGNPNAKEKGVFDVSFAHITPIGIEKIHTRLVASHNIANASEFEAFLEALGPQDNYVARSFPLRLIDPSKRGVVVMRAGWETPLFVYIPTYPIPEYFK